MLILTRRPGQSICIGEDIKITVVTGGDEPTIAVEAPDATPIQKKDLPGNPRGEITTTAATMTTKEPAAGT